MIGVRRKRRKWCSTVGSRGVCHKKELDLWSVTTATYRLPPADSTDALLISNITGYQVKTFLTDDASATSMLLCYS